MGTWRLNNNQSSHDKKIIATSPLIHGKNWRPKNAIIYKDNGEWRLRINKLSPAALMALMANFTLSDDDENLTRFTFSSDESGAADIYLFKKKKMFYHIEVVYDDDINEAETFIEYGTYIVVTSN